MNAIPAHVAGVREIVMVVPTPTAWSMSWYWRRRIWRSMSRFTIGGAQAIAAMAYGTETVPRVDKIVGPGNIYVATAKRAVFGQVGIDMIAGPSEILVVSDGQTDPDWLAMDLFSQAEHDEDAQAILVSWDSEHLDARCPPLLSVCCPRLIANQSCVNRWVGGGVGALSEQG